MTIPSDPPVGPKAETDQAIVLPDQVFAESSQVTSLDIEKFKLMSGIARYWIMPMFLLTTLAVTGMVGLLAYIDVLMIRDGTIEANNRLVTTEVVLAVIAATFAQIGAAAYLIVKSLFSHDDQ